jgi:hypothetical protein
MKNNRYVQYNHKIGLGSVVTVEGVEKVLEYEDLIEEVSKNCRGNKQMISEMNQIITGEEQRISELVDVIAKALKEFRTEFDKNLAEDDKS